MNWYKRAKQNVQFNKNLEKRILPIAQWCVNAWIKYTKNPNKNNLATPTCPFNFFNPYTKKKQYVDIVLMKYDEEYLKIIAQYFPPKNSILLYLDHLESNGFVNDITDPESPAIVASYISHELVYAIDPKTYDTTPYNYKEKRKYVNEELKKNNENIYYNFPLEVDAYCKQISYDVVRYILSDNSHKKRINRKNEVLSWLRETFNYRDIQPAFIDTRKYFGALKAWNNKLDINNNKRGLIRRIKSREEIKQESQNNNQYIKLLKQRIYNDIKDI